MAKENSLKESIEIVTVPCGEKPKQTKKKESSSRRGRFNRN